MSAEGTSLPAALSRSFLTTIVPGIVALAPWVLLLLQHTEATFGLKEYPSVAHAFLFAGVAVVGSMCNGLGTAIEANWFDEVQKKTYPVEADWFDYLSYLGHEPVGYRYLSRLFTALSFELSMVFATPAFALGGAWLLYLRFPALGMASCVLIALVTAILGAAFFCIQARQTHEALCKSRREIMTRLARSGRAAQDAGEAVVGTN